ncbi:phage head completion protein [Tsuneonella sp. HG094]
MTPAARRDTRVEFQRAAPARSALGGKTPGAGDWAAIGSRKAKVLYGTGAERRDAAVEGGTQAATFRFLLDSLTRTVTIGDRAVCKGLTYDLTGRIEIGRTEVEFTGTARRG